MPILKFIFGACRQVDWFSLDDPWDLDLQNWPNKFFNQRPRDNFSAIRLQLPELTERWYDFWHWALTLRGVFEGTFHGGLCFAIANLRNIRQSWIESKIWKASKREIHQQIEESGSQWGGIREHLRHQSKNWEELSKLEQARKCNTSPVELQDCPRRASQKYMPNIKLFLLFAAIEHLFQLCFGLLVLD